MMHRPFLNVPQVIMFESVYYYDTHICRDGKTTDVNGIHDGGGKAGEGKGGDGNSLMDGKQSDGKNKMSMGLLIGIIIGGAVLGLFIILTIFICVVSIFAMFHQIIIRDFPILSKKTHKKNKKMRDKVTINNIQVQLLKQ